MAASKDIQIIADGPKGTVIKVVYESDGSAENDVVLVDSANLSGALATTGNIRVGQANTKPFYRTDIRKLYGQGSFKTGAHVRLKDSANTICTIGAGPIDLDFDGHGIGVIHANGSIKLDTVGIGSGDAFTLFIVLKKNPNDFTSGQHADPDAFNYHGVVPR